MLSHSYFILVSCLSLHFLDIFYPFHVKKRSVYQQHQRDVLWWCDQKIHIQHMSWNGCATSGTAKGNEKESIVTYVGDKFQQLAPITEKMVCNNNYIQRWATCMIWVHLEIFTSWKDEVDAKLQPNSKIQQLSSSLPLAIKSQDFIYLFMQKEKSFPSLWLSNTSQL